MKTIVSFSITLLFAINPSGLLAAEEHQHSGEEHEHSAEEHAKHSPAPAAPEPIPQEHHHHAGMAAMYGPYSARREASGTSWQPEVVTPSGHSCEFGDWSTMTHGFVNLIYDQQGGPRGDTKTFITSMLMLMAQRPSARRNARPARHGVGGPVDGQKRLSAAAADRGDGRRATPLIDRQHPHDLFMELAASYSRLSATQLGVRLCRPAGRAGARSAGVHASVLGRGQPRGADLASLARLHAHHLRRGDARLRLGT